MTRTEGAKNKPKSIAERLAALEVKKTSLLAEQKKQKEGA